MSLVGWAGGQIGIAGAAATTHVIVRLHGLRARRIDVTHGEHANYRPCWDRRQLVPVVPSIEHDDVGRWMANPRLTAAGPA